MDKEQIIKRLEEIQEQKDLIDTIIDGDGVF